MTRHMPSTVFNNVATRGHGVGIFTDPEKITVFPEFAYLKSPPECSGKAIITCHGITYYHPSLPLYLPADSISKNRIKVRVS